MIYNNSSGENMRKITDLKLEGKTVIVRVDYNVPIKEGIVTDDNRIRQSLETINYLIEKKCKIILLSHLGKVKTKEDLEKNTLKPVKIVLEKLLNKKILFSEELKGVELEEKIKMLKSGDIILLENTRHMDYPDKLESNCDENLSKYWSTLGEIFIMDAFGSAHRAHASTVGIAKYLPSAAGFLVIKEIDKLKEIKNENKTLLLGGAKVSDKIGVIKNLINTANYVIIGGAMCGTFLKIKGYNVGKTFVDNEKDEYIKDLVNKYEHKIILPVDVMTENGEKSINEINDDETIYDIGTETIKIFNEYLSSAKLVLTNGTMGLYEDQKYEKGTKYTLKCLYDNDIKTIVCGGDTASAVKKFGYNFYYISTGGGASLEYLSGEKLPGLEVLGE